MSVPGSNLLALALTVISPQPVTYLRFLSKATNAAGVDVPTFEDPVTLYGSFQPIDAKRLAAYGLDMSKSYATFYASQSFQEIDRNRASDRFAFAGRLYQLLDKTAWAAQDGWDAAILVDIGAYP